MRNGGWGRSLNSVVRRHVNTETKQLENGPSERAVAIARAWLIISGLIVLALGIGITATIEGPEKLWGVAIAVLGITNFIVARYGSGRVAVFFSVFGP